MSNALIERHYSPRALAAVANTPAQGSLSSALADVHDAFEILGDWESRYQYIIDLGQKLPLLPDMYCTEDHRLHGCQSQVWLVITSDAGRLYIHATSDAIIVRGLIALMMQVYNGRTPAEILATPADFIMDIGLGDHISPARKNGLAALATAIRTVAAHAAEQKAA